MYPERLRCWVRARVSLAGTERPFVPPTDLAGHPPASELVARGSKSRRGRCPPANGR